MASVNFQEWMLILILSLLPLGAWFVWANFIRKPWDPDWPLDVLILFLAAIFLAPIIWLIAMAVT